MMRTFQFIIFTPVLLIDSAIAIAASRAGALGVLNLESVPDVPVAGKEINRLAKFAQREVGLKFDSRDPTIIDELTRDLPGQIKYLILTASHQDNLTKLVPELRTRGLTVLVEVTNANQAELAHSLHVDGVIAKGNEAGGWVGEETTFILLQRLLSRFEMPVWGYGGIGLHTAAACYAAGAAGVVLDSQLLLTRESRLPQAAKSAIAIMDGSETIELGADLNLTCRVYKRPGAHVVEGLAEQASQLASNGTTRTQKANEWVAAVQSSLAWGALAESAWPLGQDAAFAKPLADQYYTVGGIVEAMRQAISSHLQVARQLRPFAPNAPLAQSHGTHYPIVQGPMTRVSDRAEFAWQVAENGGLPFLALALMRAAEVETLLQETSAKLGHKPWGVGILGFVPLALRQEQLDVIRRFAPPFALIAGGRPDQAQTLEKEGIATYLHVPSPGLLHLFLQDGMRRFIFEGRECGGHVGPRSSFVLWNTMVDLLLHELPADEAQKCHILFAGGIHDRLSAAMVAAMAAPLAAKGVQLGLLMGTAYLFTEEAVASGSIMPGFQEAALQCQETILLESGPGHATRCLPTQFAHDFQQEKQRLHRAGKSAEEIRNVLEELNVGRLRVAAKGITRHPQYGRVSQVPKYVAVDQEGQKREGLYMIGQVAALRHNPCTMAELHHEVANESMGLLTAQVDSEQIKTRPRAAKPSQIAIIGMSTLLPKARDLQIFWANILNRTNAITEVPASRWDASLYFDSDRDARDKIYSKAGGFLDDILFDPLEFGIPPNSLPSIDPLHLLALVAARDALTDAGYATRPFDRSRTSVILGASGGTGDLGANYLLRSGLPLLFGKAGFDIAAQADGLLPKWTEDSFAGLLLNVVAGRIANRMDFGGLNYVVDAACASSLTAVHLSVKELETHNTDLVITGGVDTVQNPFGYLCFSKTQALSPTGQPRVFDATADGIVISEGVVMLVLKRLSDAERDGDRIYAIISAVAGSSDGRAMGMTAPRPEGQALALARAYDKAGYAPTTVGLFEAHGTGTVVGDRTEITSLGNFLKANGARPQNHAIGSIKSMIGHTKATAGVAGIAKVALALHHKVLPPTMGVTQPNPVFADSPLYINSEARPWLLTESDIPRRAGVSAFGFGGTNFHAVVEEYRDDYLGDERETAVQTWPSELLVWTADSRQELLTTLSALIASLQAGAKPSLSDLSFNLWQETQKRSGSKLRLAIVADRSANLPGLLETALTTIRETNTTYITHPQGIYFAQDSFIDDGKIAFLFPGQGSQYPGMLGQLAVYFPEVQSIFAQADRILASQFPETLSSYIFPIPTFTPEAKAAQQQALTATNVAQPALGAANMAMLTLLRAFAIQPSLAAGHSYGEYVALYAAGVLDAETLLHLSEARGRFIVEAAKGDLGTMAAVRAKAEVVQVVVDQVPDVWIANFNAPTQTIISGSKDGVATAVAQLKVQGISTQPLAVACAFHSPLVAPAQEPLAHLLQQTEMKPAQFKVFANTTAQPYPTEPKAMQTLLAQQLISPVRFADQIEAMYSEGVRLFVEVGPRQTLTGLTRQILDQRPHLAIACDAPERPGLSQLQHGLAQLFVHSVGVNLKRLFSGRKTRSLNLEALVAESADSPPATAWWVNGSRARSVQSPPETPHRPPLAAINLNGEVSQPMLPATDQPTPSSSHATLEPTVPTHPISVPPPDDAASQAMVQFQQTMGHFLDTQRKVMLRYLQNGMPQDLPPAPSLAAQGAPAPTAESIKVEPETVYPQSAAESPVEDNEPALPTKSEMMAHLLQIVSDRTGYPAEVLDVTVDMEANLGIDSIKRVEILGIFQNQFLPADFHFASGMMDELTSIKTLAGVVDWLEQTLRVDPEPAANGHPTPTTTKNDTIVQRIQLAEPTKSTNPSHIARYLLALTDAPPLPEAIKPLVVNGVMLVTDDGQGVAKALVKRLRQHGQRAVWLRAADEDEGVALVDLSSPQSVADAVVKIRQQYGSIGGIIHLGSLTSGEGWKTLEFAEWQHRLQHEVKGLFYLLKETAVDLKQKSRAWVIAATGLAGAANAPLAFPGQAGVAGLLKSLAQEWPHTICKAVHLDPTLTTSALAEQLWREMTTADGLVEISYSNGQRQFMRPIAAPLSPADNSPELVIEPDWVILVTGGLRGITAEIALDMARRYRPTLILVGRSAMPSTAEAQHTAGLTSAKALKAALMAQLRQNGDKVQVAQVEAAYSQLLKEREMRQNWVRFQATGAKVHYRTVDVCDEQEMADLIETVYREYGHLDGVIHGAGIIEDKLIEQKTADSFDRVFDTKANSTFMLSRLLPSDSVKFLALFASAAGTFGNRGQTDYAATNEVVGCFARHLDQQWSGRVVALNWGPWLKKGMVSTELQREFAKRNIELIPIEAGCYFFDHELRLGQKGDVAVVIGGGAWSGLSESKNGAVLAEEGLPTHSFDPNGNLPLLQGAAVPAVNGSRIELIRYLDKRVDLYLQDHKLDGRMVFPVAMAMELMAEAVQHGWPDMQVAGLRDLQVLNGIIVGDEALPLRMMAQTQTEARYDRLGIDVQVQIVAADTGRLHYRAVVEMVNDLPAPPDYQLPILNQLQPFPLTIAESYEQWLFHGPLFQGIDEVKGISPNHLAAQMAPSTPQMYLAHKADGHWLIDPCVFDSALQLIILWMRHYQDSTPLPSRFAHYHRFGSLSQSPITCYLIVPEQVRGHLLEVDIAFVDGNGRLVGLLEKMECPASQALNRLTGIT